jgi:mannose-6-phosphate isomerase class I
MGASPMRLREHATAMPPDYIKRFDGLVRLRPTFVQRFYPDLNRLGQRKLKTRASDWLPERWIGSSVEAINPPPLRSGGLSMIDAPRGAPPVSLRDAIRAAPQQMIGEELLAKHGPEFRVLVKLLDPAAAIVFHLHATDAQVQRMPRNFAGHRFGKDEAYYFLDGAPKGPLPYTHAGLHAGVTRRELIDAVRRGPDVALELSPAMYQEYGTGFFTPAGVPHRPGTALTLEIQQPSDVYTLLETHSGGRAMSAEQMHPGFNSLDAAFALVDFKTSTAVGKLDQNRLTPRIIEQSRGNEVAWVFPPDLCGKFAGKRLRVSRRLTHRERSAVILWLWKGRGTIDGRRVRAGDELFVAHGAATRRIEIINDGDEMLEAFTFFPV